MNMDMQALIEEMNVLIEKIKSGTATLGELEAFTAAASELHQRSIILRYKAYEAKIYGTPVTATPEVVQAEKPLEDVRESEAVIQPVDTSLATTAPETEEEISFDLFADTDEQEAMDLFSEPSVNETKNTPVTAMHVVSDTATVEATQETTTQKEVSLATAEVVPQEPVKEDTNVHSTILQEETQEVVVEVTSTQAETTPEPVSVELENAPVTEQPENVVSGNEHPVYSRLTMEDNSLAARLMAVRLESLKGAFGFNERLQIIQELFNGSNDAFTQAIDHIDTSSSKSEARMFVSRIAHQFEWDKDSNLALEFVQKVERRFA